jgi:glycosyltransferase involved in cell wall biosynthesis
MSEARPQISGFTIVRNATILAYPFRESVRSLMPLVDELVLNCGDSDDDTAEICEELAKEFPGKIHVFRSVWRREGQQGGFQLKVQTDEAIAKCRGRWCFYLQADEVLHEEDFAKIRWAVERADNLPEVDGILFDWVHFYGSYDYEIRGRKWYRRECRLFKNGRGITAFRDAQGFRKDGKRVRVIPSGARVFHYGYVRTPKGLLTKSQEMSQWWGEAPSAVGDMVRHVGLQKFTSSHPKVMGPRISETPHWFDPKRYPRRWDKAEIKNALALLWESIFPFRLGEFRNYELHGGR